MKVVSIDSKPFEVLHYARVMEGSKGVEKAELPFHWAYVDRMPQGVSAIIATSDLQGVAIESVDGSEAVVSDQYMGHNVAEKCKDILTEQGISPRKTGVILAGDLHSDVSLQKRGGFGDVRDVWMAFHNEFKWVVGVAGNHDTFGTKEDFAPFRATYGKYFLHGSTCVIDGIRFSGVSGVISRSNKKPWRNLETDHLKMIDTALTSSPHFLILHEGPSIKERGLPGNDVITRQLEKSKPAFVICGHRHWPTTEMCSLANGTQIISTDSKVFIFRKKKQQYPWQQQHPTS